MNRRKFLLGSLAASTAAVVTPAVAHGKASGEPGCLGLFDVKQTEHRAGGQINPVARRPDHRFGGRLRPEFTFANHVQGPSNHLARVAARQAGVNPGGPYNPLYIYGGQGVGKTHLMLAAGHTMLEKNPGARVVYVHAEKFVEDMVEALRVNAISEFRSHYHGADAVLIDDIQFLAGRERSQREFFCALNTLLENRRQVIIAADRCPSMLDGFGEHLISRFSGGLVTPVKPPEFETRVEILRKFASRIGFSLADDVSSLLAERIRTNVRELEGALRQVRAATCLVGRSIDMTIAVAVLNEKYPVLS